MATAVLLGRKALGLILDAMDARISAETARYTREDVTADAAGDFGNDLHYLTGLRAEFAAAHAADQPPSMRYTCWFDTDDQCLSLVRHDREQALRDQGSLSPSAVVRYTFVADTYEEACAIHSLRQGWAPYLPMGAAAPCPTCAATYYPECYGDCWRCGPIG